MAITWRGSPNYAVESERPVLGVVIHDAECDLLTMRNTFAMAGGVSAHYGIGYSGEIDQYVSEYDVAFHVLAFGSDASKNRNRPDWLPAYNGRYSAVNRGTVGIELAGYAARGFQPAQYEALGQLVADICERHGIPPTLPIDHGPAARIVTHGWLQTDRSDPGLLFDWQAFRAALTRALEGDDDMARVAELEAQIAQLNGVNTELQSQVDSLSWLLGLAQGERDAEAAEAARLRDLVENGAALSTEDADKLARYERVREAVLA